MKLLALALLVVSVLGATMQEDGRCAGMPQQLEQEKMDRAWQLFSDLFNLRLTVQAKWHRLTQYYQYAYIHPEFPGDLIRDWQPVRQAARALDPRKLDKYQYAQTMETMDKAGPFSRPGMDQVCADALEEYWMFGDECQQYTNSIWMIPGSFRQTNAPWQQQYIVPVYNSTTFQNLVQEVQAYCPYLQTRINGDWWLKAYQYVTARGGFVPSSGVSTILSALSYEISVNFNATLGNANPILKGVIDRGYPITLAERTQMLNALSAAQACLIQYRNYTAVVAPPLSTLTTSTDDWLIKRMPSQCAWQLAEKTYNFTPQRAKYLFDTWRADADALIAVANATMYQLYPNDYLGYNLSYVHLQESVILAMNRTFMGYSPSSICGTWNPLVNGTNYWAIELAALQKISDTTLFTRTANTMNRPMLARDTATCRFLTGNGYSYTYMGHDPNVFTTAVIESSPYFFRNTTYGVLMHEYCHVNQLGMGTDSACDKCWTRRYIPYSGEIPMQANVMGFGSFGYFAMTTYGSMKTVSEGAATWTASFFGVEQGLFDKYEKVNEQMMIIRSRYVTAMRSAGYLAPPGQGWVSDEDCASWYQTHTWTPSSSWVAAVNLCRSTRLNIAYAGPSYTSTTLFYVDGMQRFKDWYSEAKAKCGSALDPRYFTSLYHAGGQKSSAVTEMLYRDYIDSGCKEIYTKYGDCWRTIQPVRRSDGVAYLP